MRRGEYQAAIREYDRAVALDSADGPLLNDRGMAHVGNSDYAAAIRDFDRALAVNPQHGQALRNRSRARFYLGRYAEAAADMEKALPSDTANAYVPIWLYIAKRRIGQGSRAELAAQLAKTDSTVWPTPVGKFYLGQITAAQLIDASTRIDPRVKRDQRCAASFFLGQDAMIRKQPAEARTLFEEVRATCPHDWTEYHSAVAELSRLAEAPAQP